MITLTSSQPFARGGKRDCFVHPLHADRCVKVPRLDSIPSDLKRRASWFRSVRKGVDAFDENVSDWTVLHSLKNAGDKAIWSHIPEFFGWEETDRGRGLVIELLRDEDGLISRTLLDWLWEHGYDERTQAAVTELAAYWEARVIPSRSLGLHNIVAQVMPGGKLRLVVIDGLGSTEFIPFSKWSRAYALRRSRSKIAGLRVDIDDLIARKKRNQGPGSRGFLLSRH
ncbi:MAG TPA: YrbL family protein [Roseimicrobium sp.]|nr:YrbL family protein [Roseimicrobium sp.]